MSVPLEQAHYSVCQLELQSGSINYNVPATRAQFMQFTQKHWIVYAVYSKTLDNTHEMKLNQAPSLLSLQV